LTVGNKQLEISRQLHLHVNSVNRHSQIVKVSALGQTAVAKADAPPSTPQQEDEEWSVHTLHPGMLVTATVDGTMKNGIGVTFLKYFRGTISRVHLGLHQAQQWEGGASSELGPLDERFPEGSKMEARVIFIDPVSKRASLSLLDTVLTLNMAIPNSKALDAGTFVQEAKIVHINTARGMTVMLRSDGAATAESTSDAAATKKGKKKTKAKAAAPFVLGLGLVTTGNSSDEITVRKSVGKSFKLDEVHAVRIIGTSMFDGLTLVSMKQSIIDQQVLLYKDVQPGQLLKGTVQEFGDFGVVVSLAPNIRGVCTVLHMADVAITSVPVSSLAKVGQKITCRVLTCNAAKRSVQLTQKKSLVKSKLPVITTYEEATPGLVTDGFVTKIAHFGLLVTFYNNVHGLVSAKSLQKQGVEDPSEQFTIGQVVRCGVVWSDAAQAKLALTLDLQNVDKLASSNSRHNVETNNKPLPLPKVGSTLVCTVTDGGVQENKATVRVKDTGFLCTMFAPHMRDTTSACSTLDMTKFLDGGDELGECVVLSVDAAKKTCKVSKKPLLVNAAKHRQSGKKGAGSFEPFLPSSIDQLSPGLLVCGFVRRVVEFGVFVEFLNNLSALLPKGMLADEFVQTTDGVFQQGDSVICQVQDVDAEADKIIVSLKGVSHVRMPATHFTPALLFVRSRLADRTVSIFHHLQDKEENFTFTEGAFLAQGSLGKAIVTKGFPDTKGEDHDSESVMLLDLEGRKALLPSHLSNGDDLEIGSEVTVRVLDYNCDLRAYTVSCADRHTTVPQPEKKKKKSAAAANAKVWSAELSEGTSTEVVVDVVQGGYAVVSDASGSGHLGILQAGTYTAPNAGVGTLKVGDSVTVNHVGSVGAAGSSNTSAGSGLFAAPELPKLHAGARQFYSLALPVFALGKGANGSATAQKKKKRKRKETTADDGDDAGKQTICLSPSFHRISCVSSTPTLAYTLVYHSSSLFRSLPPVLWKHLPVTVPSSPIPTPPPSCFMVFSI
jgi:rRNA biogenesis protein RRP5